MKVGKLLATTGVMGVTTASLVVSPALAWHPQAGITKSVQDVTSNSQVVKAPEAVVNVNNKTNSTAASQVITVAPGDTLKYVVLVENPAPTVSNKDNDLANAKVTDKLPQGVQQTNSMPTTNDIADLAPGQSKSYEYDVKVTNQTDGDMLTNKACVTGGSAIGDVTGLKACSSVTVKVEVPQQPTPTPSPSPAPQQPTSLPNTGTGNFIAPAAVVAILAYAGYLLRLKRHAA